MTRKFTRSEEFLQRALKTIPLGSQTFSKSITQYPKGVSPFFIQKAKGSRIWDIDGNEYLDLNNALAAITLGHNDPDVNQAVLAQMEEGIIFPLPHPVETYVAEKICEMVPSVERVRFGKNGSDATAGAVRVARAFTKRDRIAVCGYHGWQDWYIGSTTRNLGVPKATQDLTHMFQFNNIQSLDELFKKHPGEFAGVIMEVMSGAEPTTEFLNGVRELTQKNGALLIFDETITGFRHSESGAQGLFGVQPDLSTFGKGLANGYPLSAIGGRADVMKLMEEVFFSFTFGGEALSLAASLATMKKMQTQPVIKTIRETGGQLMNGVKALLEKHDASHLLGISGNNVLNFLGFKDSGKYTQWQIRTLFMQEVFQKGIFTIGAHAMSYAHTHEDVKTVLTAYDDIFGTIKKAVDGNEMSKLLRCDP